MIAACDDLVAALFPRHFGPYGLPQSDLDGLSPRRCNRRCGRFRARSGSNWRWSPTPAPAPGRALDIAAAFAAALPKVRALADSDARAGFAGDPSATSVDEVIFSFPGFAAVLRHRLAHLLHSLGAPMIARIASEDAHGRTGIDIHPGAEIGERFFIDHGTGVVIGETAIIGCQCAALPGRHPRRETVRDRRAPARCAAAIPRHPIVEDDVVIYAGATILGRVVIGRGSTIGGGVWLTQSAPPGSHITQATPRQESYDNGAGI